MTSFILYSLSSDCFDRFFFPYMLSPTVENLIFPHCRLLVERGISFKYFDSVVVKRHRFDTHRYYKNIDPITQSECLEIRMKMCATFRYCRNCATMSCTQLISHKHLNLIDIKFKCLWDRSMHNGRSYLYYNNTTCLRLFRSIVSLFPFNFSFQHEVSFPTCSQHDLRIVRVCYRNTSALACYYFPFYT